VLSDFDIAAISEHPVRARCPKIGDSLRRRKSDHSRACCPARLNAGGHVFHHHALGSWIPQHARGFQIGLRMGLPLVMSLEVMSFSGTDRPAARKRTSANGRVDEVTIVHLFLAR
jgi:hypothetical protein